VHQLLVIAYVVPSSSILVILLMYALATGRVSWYSEELCGYLDNTNRYVNLNPQFQKSEMAYDHESRNTKSSNNLLSTANSVVHLCSALDLQLNNTQGFQIHCI
jgi:hypothetical protein